MNHAPRFRILLAALCMLVAGGCAHHAQREAPRIVPLPQSVQRQAGELKFAQVVALRADAAAPHAGRALSTLLAQLEIRADDAAPTRVLLQLKPDEALPAEGYRLTIADDITLSATSDTGLFYAVQSLRQMLPPRAQAQYRLPHVTISDAPRHAWRGSSLDVARSFLPIEYLQKHIERMALFKLNRLHLHLSDDQGWRIEIKRYPRLTEIGGASAVKGGRTGYYTQDELRQLVAHAQARGVTLVPEIDMPGHVQAALASYHELACDDVSNLAPYDGLEVGFSVLCLDKPEVIYPFVENVLREVLAIFPSREIHIGGDEIKHPRYAEFVARAAAIVESMGRTPILWEEGSVADTQPQVLLQLWNDGYDIAPAVAKGHPLILSPCSYFYLDHGNFAGQPETYDWCRKQGVPLARSYAFDDSAYPTAVGIEAALWSEWVHSDATADNRLWPRLGAVAEVAWSPAASRDYASFRQRMGALRAHLDQLGVAYYTEPDLGWATTSARSTTLSPTCATASSPAARRACISTHSTAPNPRSQ